MLTQSELKELLEYNPLTGEFRWKTSRGHVKKGTIAGTLMNRGYIHIKINGQLYLAHRLAWLYMNDTFPEQVDHADRNRTNNAWNNLRATNNAGNQQNRKPNKNSTSKYTGVAWDKKANRWRAYIRVNKKLMWLGYYDTPQEAHQAYLDAKVKYHTFNPIPR